ncbi:VOC family protein [Actinocrispum wychmicini]|uniref:Catechol 2,3-dioxygenase-like lactoylglutathione lyase family enzyme n=1 Tax=Actinocrispum wychmicini TaxID=1213861 RepID=A0A4V2S8R2_9PSEU|nr:VOC family protein [Actinocrispum wychmicini]TCO64910.1 catechol 2,3-dioxygenase-like lactoylglutathione lyase family enzyme [Actinocrispum wychmicini]
MDVTQIRLIVSDFPVVYRFYRDVIGLKPQFETENGPYVAFKPDLGSTLALHSRAELATIIPDLKPGDGDNTLVALRVDDVDEYLAELTSRGASCTDPVVLDGRIKVSYLRDPEGHLLEIQQWLATRTGAAVPPAS